MSCCVENASDFSHAACRHDAWRIRVHLLDTLLVIMFINLAPARFTVKCCTPLASAIISSWIPVFDQFRWVIAYKLLLLNILAFLCMEACASPKLTLARVATDAAWFMLAGLLAPLASSFALDACRRVRFCRANAVPAVYVGPFWLRIVHWSAPRPAEEWHADCQAQAQ